MSESGMIPVDGGVDSKALEDLAKHLKVESPYFDHSKINDPEPRFVCWLDLVGASNAMKLSLPRAANFIGKIHVAGLRAASGTPVKAYPVIDGFYAIAANKVAISDFLRKSIAPLAVAFATEKDHYKRFLIRCGLAFGPVIEGTELAKGAKELAKAKCYSDNVAIGIAISQAYESEKLAPFFGVHIHESARAFAPHGAKPFGSAFHHWLKPGNADDAALSKIMKIELSRYFDWAKQHANTILFPTEKLPHYQQLCAEYFE